MINKHNIISFFFIFLFFQNFGINFKIDFLPFSIVIVFIFVILNYKYFLDYRNQDLVYLYLIIFFTSLINIINVFSYDDYLLIGQELNSLKGIILISISLIIIYSFSKNLHNISEIFLKNIPIYFSFFLLYAIIEILYKFTAFKFDFFLKILSFLSFDEKGYASKHLTLFFREHSFASILLNIISSYLIINVLNHNLKIHHRIISFFGYLVSISSLIFAFSKLGLITAFLVHFIIIFFFLVFFWKKGLILLFFTSTIVTPVVIILSKNTSFNLIELTSLTFKIFSNSLYSSYLKVKSFEIFTKDPLLIFFPQGVNNFKYILNEYLNNQLLNFNNYPITEEYMLNGIKTSDGQFFYIGILGEFGILFFVLLISFIFYLIFKFLKLFFYMFLNRTKNMFFQYLFLFTSLIIILLSFFSMHAYNLFYIFIFIGIIFYELRKKDKFR